MQAFQARLDSFSKSKRVKPPTGKSSSSIKWPHPSGFLANPFTLADAGFYFCPTWEDRDNVQCFMCHKELSDWADDDDPFEIHWSKCRTSCAWAIVRCGLNDDTDSDGNFVFRNPDRIPSCKSMEKARLETFVGWPHGSRNHGANEKKMAHAGFVYTPQVIGDDTATCLYCDVSLSGWDDDDEPMEEHSKREKKAKTPCPFLSSNRKAPKKGRTKAQKTAQQESAADEPEGPAASTTLKLTNEPEVVVKNPKRGRSTKEKAVKVSEEVRVDDGPEELTAAKSAKIVRKVRKPTRQGNRTGDTDTDTPLVPMAAKPIKPVLRPESRPRSENGEADTVPASAPVEPKPRSRSAKSRALRKTTTNVSVLDPPSLAVAESNAEETMLKVVEISTNEGEEAGCDDTPQETETLEPPTNTTESSIPSRITLDQPLDDSMKNLTNSTKQSAFCAPLLANVPHKIDSLSEWELEMTVEEWIRHEIEQQYEQFKVDGERAIMMFQERSAEVKLLIESA